MNNNIMVNHRNTDSHSMDNRHRSMGSSSTMVNHRNTDSHSMDNHRSIT